MPNDGVKLPSDVKRRRGTEVNSAGESRKRQVQAPSGRPDCPAHLSGVAAVAFEDLCDRLESINMLSPADIGILELYAVTYAAWREACIKCDLDGMQLGLKRHPATMIRREMGAQLLQLEKQFGLTPSSRNNVSADSTAPAGFAAVMKEYAAA